MLIPAGGELPSHYPRFPSVACDAEVAISSTGEKALFKSPQIWTQSLGVPFRFRFKLCELGLKIEL